jgi:hypothetical protein
MKLSSMNTNQLRDMAVALGADKKRLYGTSKQAMIWKIEALLKEQGVESVGNLKRLDELKKGWFSIVTDHGIFDSYFDFGRQIFKGLPNEYRILGFVQD